MSLFAFASWAKLQGSHDDDWTDRVSHLWTVSFLVLFTILVSSVQYVGDPIQCWCPAYFTGVYVSYTKYICWISNTYYVQMEESIPTDIEERKSKEISYYQWVPIIFLFQAFMFKCPNLVWRMLSNSGGVNIDHLVELAETTQLGKPEDKEKIINQVAKYLDNWLKAHRHYHYNLLVRIRHLFGNIFCFWFAKREGKFLVGFYLFVKFLYVANVFFQFFILNTFLSMNYTFYGIEVLDTLVKEGEFTDSPRFPRVTLCDFEIRQLQNIQRYTVQCVLSINLFNEKIFIFLWFWYLFVALIACLSYVSWLYRFLMGHKRTNYVKKYLQIMGNVKTENDSALIKKFADEYLRDDGVFVLRMVSKNSSELVLIDLVNSLWDMYKENPFAILPNEDNQKEPKRKSKKSESSFENDDDL